jgi:hypothetical protein
MGGAFQDGDGLAHVTVDAEQMIWKRDASRIGPSGKANDFGRKLNEVGRIVQDDAQVRGRNQFGGAVKAGGDDREASREGFDADVGAGLVNGNKGK